MTQNLIDLELSAESLAAIDAALATLETHLTPLLGLDPESRRGLTKMGHKSEAFCRQAVVAFSQNAEVLPRNFDLAAYRRDLATLDALRPRRQRMGRAMDVGVLLLVEMAEAIDHRLRLLSGCRIVEPDQRLAMHLRLQDREVALDRVRIEGTA